MGARGLRPPIVGRVENKQQVASLTGLRGIAALIVVVGHFTNETGFLRGVIGGGGPHLGVLLFFLLSAYLMMWVYHESGVAPWRFLWNRFARVYPLFVVAVASGLVIGHFAGWANYASITRDNLLPHLYFHDGNVVFWTIGPEILFYGVFALMLFLPGRVRVGAILVAGAALAIGWPWIVHLNFMTHLGVHGMLADSYYVYKTFLIGLLCYLAARHIPQVKGNASSILSFVVLLAAVSMLPNFFESELGRRPDPETYAFSEPITVLAFAALLIGATRLSSLQRLLSHRWMIVAGEVSFSLYLFHYLVLVIWQHLGLAAPNPLGLASFVLAALGFSWIVHVTFEKPSRRWLRDLPDLAMRTVRKPAASMQEA